MQPLIRFISKSSNAQARHLKLVVHGYLSATNEGDRSRLLELLPMPAAHEEVFLACWDAGQPNELLTRSLQGALSGFVGFNKLTLARSAFLAAKGGVGHFLDKKKQSAQVGQALLSELQQALHAYPQIEHISLYGHSLGARVVIEALLNSEPSPKLPIQNLVLMGAARAIATAELDCLLTKLQGQLFNFYSRKDQVLITKPSLGKWAGRHPLTESTASGRLHNIQLDIGHSDYWQLLPDIFTQVANPQQKVDFTPLDKPRSETLQKLSKRIKKLSKKTVQTD